VSSCIPCELDGLPDEEPFSLIVPDSVSIECCECEPDAGGCKKEPSQLDLTWDRPDKTPPTINPCTVCGDGYGLVPTQTGERQLTPGFIDELYSVPGAPFHGPPGTLRSRITSQNGWTRNADCFLRELYAASSAGGIIVPYPELGDTPFEFEEDLTSEFSVALTHHGDMKWETWNWFYAWYWEPTPGFRWDNSYTEHTVDWSVNITRVYRRWSVWRTGDEDGCEYTVHAEVNLYVESTGRWISETKRTLPDGSVIVDEQEDFGLSFTNIIPGFCTSPSGTPGRIDNSYAYTESGGGFYTDTNYDTVSTSLVNSDSVVIECGDEQAHIDFWVG
jgi:hypothetical protein